MLLSQAVKKTCTDHPRRNRQTGGRQLRGFTLIELMIVVAIVGIVAAVAIPAYMDYVIRVQISEGMSLTGGAKSAVASYYQEYGSFPTDNEDAALPPAASISGDFVSSVSVSGSVITVLYSGGANSQISGQTVTLAATSVAGSLTWNCASGGAIEVKHLPRSCN